MGNGAAKIRGCLTGCVAVARRRETDVMGSEPYDEGLGHSFCYIRPETPFPQSGSHKVHNSEETTTFRSISGAAVSANTATPLSTALLHHPADGGGALFESSTSFSSAPLYALPRFSGHLSGPFTDRGFLSGPIDRGGFMSGPLDPQSSTLFSGPLDRLAGAVGPLRRSFSHGLDFHRRTATSLLRILTKAVSRAISVPIRRARESDSSGSSSTNHLSSLVCEDVECFDSSGGGGENIHWAQGRAGEDRIHVVISEEHGLLFVGIYDGFNGPDATDYLLSNLYSAVQQELKGILWDEDKQEGLGLPCDGQTGASWNKDSVPIPSSEKNCSMPEEINGGGKKGMTQKKRIWGPARKCEEKQRRWKYEWARERSELDRSLNELSRSSSESVDNHLKVLKALSQALKKTEDAFLQAADTIVSENPELALMGSCVLVMVMKGEDVYLLNVGDSRAVLAQKAEADVWGSLGRDKQKNLERINEETLQDLENHDDGCAHHADALVKSVALQLTKDHSTSEEEETWRIRNEHPEDASAIANDRVKGSLKVTRAFGAGFLKQPKWNNALLEMFRIDYIGTSPYITCSPFLYHMRLSPRDKFLILSSDGLYQYFTNEEAVAKVESFIASNPEGDPAQHLVEEVLFRAAKNAGMDFYELLEIPQGDRRRYHDDVSIIVISFEGRIWRSFM